MASGQEINRKIRLQLDVQNWEKSQKAIDSISKEIQDLIKDQARLISQYGNTDNAIASITSEFVRQSKAARDLKQDFMGVGAALDSTSRQVASALKKLVIPTSVFDAVETTNRFNKTLVELAARTGRFGVGIGKLTDEMKNLANANSILREDTAKLFKLYSTGFVLPSLTGFGNILKNIKEVTGANVEAMNEYMSALSSISQKFPSMQAAFENMSKADKERTQAQINMLLWTKKISLEEYRRANEYLTQQDEMTAADKAESKAKQQQVDAIQKMRQQVERVALKVGGMLMPVLDQVAKIVDVIGKHIDTLPEGWGKWSLGIMAVLPAVKMIGTMLSALKGGGGMLAGIAKASTGKAGGAGLFGGLSKEICGCINAGNAAQSLTDAGGVGWNGPDARRRARRRGGEMRRVRMDARRWVRGKKLGVRRFGRGIAGLPGRAMGYARGVSLGSIKGGLDRAGAGVLRGGWKGIGGAGRVIGGIGKAIGRGSPAAIITGIVGELGLGALQGHLQSKGNTRGAAAAGLGKNLLGVGGMAATGAMLGGLTGPLAPIAAPLGAIAGGLYGLVSNWKEIGSDFKALLGGGGKKEGAAKAPAEIPLAERIRKSTEAGMKRGTETGYDIKRIKQLEEQYKQMKDQNEVLTKQWNEYNAIEDKTEEVKEKMAAIRKEQEKTKVEMKGARAEIQAMNESLSYMKDVVEAIRGVRDAETSLYSEMIEKAGLLGQFDDGTNKRLDEQLVKVRELIKNHALAAEHAAQFLEANRENTKLGKEQLTFAQLSAALGKDEAARFKAKYGEAVTAAVMEQAIADYHKEAATQTKLEVQAGRQRTKQYDEILAQSESEVQYATQMVTLWDNMGVGVKASAQMRMQAIGAMDKQLSILEKQEQVFMDENKHMQGQPAYVKTVLDYENKRLQIQTAQAEQARALRDGWVSAIKASHTGAGRFTKFVIDQEHSTASMLRMLGKANAIVSNISGSTVGGFDQASRFTLNGMTGPTGLPYATTNMPFPMARTPFESMQQQATGFYNRLTNQAMSGGGYGQAMTAQGMYKSAGMTGGAPATGWATPGYFMPGSGNTPPPGAVFPGGAGAVAAPVAAAVTQKIKEQVGYAIDTQKAGFDRDSWQAIEYQRAPGETSQEKMKSTWDSVLQSHENQRQLQQDVMRYSGAEYNEEKLNRATLGLEKERESEAYFRRRVGYIRDVENAGIKYPEAATAVFREKEAPGVAGPVAAGASAAAKTSAGTTVKPSIVSYTQPGGGQMLEIHVNIGDVPTAAKQIAESIVKMINAGSRTPGGL